LLHLWKGEIRIVLFLRRGKARAKEKKKRVRKRNIKPIDRGEEGWDIHWGGAPLFPPIRKKKGEEEIPSRKENEIKGKRNRVSRSTRKKGGEGRTSNLTRKQRFKKREQRISTPLETKKNSAEGGEKKGVCRSRSREKKEKVLYRGVEGKNNGPSSLSGKKGRRGMLLFSLPRRRVTAKEGEWGDGISFIPGRGEKEEFFISWRKNSMEEELEKKKEEANRETFFLLNLPGKRGRTAIPDSF